MSDAAYEADKAGALLTLDHPTMLGRLDQIEARVASAAEAVRRAAHAYRQSLLGAAEAPAERGPPGGARVDARSARRS